MTEFRKTNRAGWASAPRPTGIPFRDDVPEKHRDDMLRNGPETSDGGMTPP